MFMVGFFGAFLFFFGPDQEGAGLNVMGQWRGGGF